MTTGERIRELRNKWGLTQANLAYKVDTDSASISRWERDRVSVSQKYILRLAKALRTTSDYLLGKTDNPDLVNEEVTEKEIEKRTNKSEFMERLVRNQPMIVYEVGDERMLIPATLEGFNFIREMRGEKNAENLAIAK